MFLERAIKDFGNTVIKEAKENLKRKDKNASGELSKSLDYDYLNRNEIYSITFKSEDYGKFIDAGVHGVGGTKADGSKWKKKRVFGSSFRYKSKRPPHIAFNGWTIRRGIAPRSKGGQFQKRKGLLFAIANSVYHTGLETTHFFTKPLDKGFKTLSNEVLDAYSLDVDELLKVSLND